VKLALMAQGGTRDSQAGGENGEVTVRLWNWHNEHVCQANHRPGEGCDGRCEAFGPEPTEDTAEATEAA